MINHFFTKQFIGFLVVGGTAAVLHWVARFTLSIWMPFWLAVIFAYAIGMVCAFVLNSKFIFPNSTKPRSEQARSFVLINLGFFPVVALFAMQFNSWLKMWGMLLYTEEVAHALAILIPMFATFLLYKFHTFRDSPHEK
jgi:putative flippase GtrA